MLDIRPRMSSCTNGEAAHLLMELFQRLVENFFAH